jgi:hypothetical protein
MNNKPQVASIKQQNKLKQQFEAMSSFHLN